MDDDRTFDDEHDGSVLRAGVAPLPQPPSTAMKRDGVWMSDARRDDLVSRADTALDALCRLVVACETHRFDYTFAFDNAREVVEELGGAVQP